MALERLGARGGRAEQTQEHELVALLRRQGISCTLLSSDADLNALTANANADGDAPTLALVDAGYMTTLEVRRCLQACADADVRTLALVPPRRMASLDAGLPMTDFIASPPDPDELTLRAQRALAANADAEDADSHVIRAGELQIDTSSYEVTVDGERVSLRFKEYELLKLLAENPGRVFSRDALLNQIWGYEYFGGTRTVDVHIRRLRSKIADAEYHFIETIWNVGYRFKESR